MLFFDVVFVVARRELKILKLNSDHVHEIERVSYIQTCLGTSRLLCVFI